MPLVVLWLLLMLAALAPGACADTPPPIKPSPYTLVIHPARVIDVRRGLALEDVMILVESGKIVRVGPARDFYPPRGATFINLPGMWVMLSGKVISRP